MKKYFILLLLASFFNINIQAQFEMDSIRDFYLNFYDVHWQDTLDQYYINDTDLMVLANLTINGITYDSVGVRYKGNSSCMPGQIKNPFHIELDTIKNQDFMGVTTFKLSNGFKDPTFVREVMSYEALGNYMACSKSNFVQLYADGQLIGLYNSNQTINKDFVETHFYSRENPR
ncbi:MAG: CotH kinase family protein, partial [Bacteroidales bacterium]|nr:CotH kinase family protein [Bacteroidales bacterium]